MKATEKIKYGALIYAGLKSLQQVASDLALSFTKGSPGSVLSFGTEQYARIGSSAAVAFSLEEAVSSAEKLIMPKPFQGAAATGLATAGVAGFLSHYGQHFGYQLPMQEAQEAIAHAPEYADILKDVLHNYYQAFEKLVTFNSDVHGGYLAGALFTAKSAGRFAYNLVMGIAEHSARNIEIKKQNKKK